MITPFTQLNILTKKRVLRRIDRLPLDNVPDPRGFKGRRHRSFTSFLSALSLGLLTGQRTRRDVSSMTHDLPLDVRRTLNIPAPISSTRLRDTLKIVDHEGLRRVLRRQVRHDRRCGFLKPSGLAINAVAIDGKFPADLKSWDHPAAQKVVLTPSTARGRCRVLNALLISSQSPACLDASPIPGKTNEIGHMPDFLKDLDEAYGKTGLLELIMADGGNSSRGIASQIHAMGSAYALRLTNLQGGIASDALRALNRAEVVAKRTEARGGTWVTHRLYRVTTENQRDYGWQGLSEWIRIERETSAGDVGHRDWAVSLDPERLSDDQWLEVLRRYWRVENTLHHTLDTVWREDASRPPWIATPAGVLALMILRRIAFNLLSVLRVRTQDRQIPGRPISWRQLLRIIDHMMVAPRAGAATL